MAGKNVIEYLIRAKDDASKTFGDIEGAADGMSMGVIAGAAGMTAALALLTKVMIDSVNAAREFNRELSNLGTLIPGQTARITEFREAIQDLSVFTTKSTDDLAKGAYQVVSAFQDTSDSMGILEMSAMAARAGVSETTDALNLISMVTKGYGDTSYESAQKVADLAFWTVKMGQTTFPELAGAMGRIVALSKELGVSMEEMFSVYATLTGATGNAALVTTQYLAMMNAMISRTDEAELALKALGYTSVQTAVQEKGLVAVMQAMVNQTDASSEEVKKLFKNVRALPAVMALSGSQADVFAMKLNDSGEAAGSLLEAFYEATEGVDAMGTAFDRLHNITTTIKQDIGETLTPGLQIMAADAATILSELWNVMDLMGKQRRMMLAGADDGPPLWVVSTEDILAGSLQLAEGNREKALEIAGAWMETNNQAREANREYQSIGDKLREIGEGKWEGAVPKLGDVIVLEGMNEAAGKAAISLDEYLEIVKELGDEWRADWMEQARARVEGLTEVVVNFSNALSLEEMAAGLGTVKLWIEQTDTLKDSIGELLDELYAGGKVDEGPIRNPAAEQFYDLLHSWDVTAADVAGSISGHFASAFTSMIGNASSAIAILKQMFQDLALSIFEMFAQQMLFQGILPGVAGMFGGGGGGGGIMGFNQAYDLAMKIPSFNFRGGAEVFRARNGLEVFGGQYMRDTVPALIGKGEVVQPAPTVERMNKFLDRAERGGVGGGPSVVLQTLFFGGTKNEALNAARFFKKKTDQYEPFVIPGKL